VRGRDTVAVVKSITYVAAIQACTLTEIAGLDIDGLDNGGPDIDGRIWAIDCNQLKITIERFYQLTGTYNSFVSVLCLKTYEIHIDKQKL